ncbi:protein kinase domain containing protein [Entamoeba histolytica HM-1:IMSS-B]|uniref:Protein kinase domain containing protein n=6 Tax=Entamoeba histolytica TaxID=5759 RepID=C4M8V5_ENTH1|nr:protein kinase domain containing protein [Entamoeba histolytica HM-1:IMSS]EMD44144.1 serine/threonine protein kinase, putative [Entamoeba histolytica KU27]EMH76466.1 protein kinase domain containing protein [Entamoeba histolytica HM-1:IMSS-B]EMS13609.1 serine-threonine protein kinase, putative [Entamoeba histolytica HM-3:IMSS]ENY59780.1 serine-threonine protein kinase, putative [Entamoeba histolytica HM-1:IMSS-A]GAT98045.1 protein kinase domain containing protein [Entamoeba histolytica]|eukprot:XP_650377.1 protein kinase domain containing protein [Entamoeba histolytica HM-1:IMSS]
MSEESGQQVPPAMDLFRITFHSHKKLYDLFWKVVEPLSQIQRVQNTIVLKNGIVIPFQLAPVSSTIPSLFAKKQQHILLCPLSDSNLEDKIRTQLELFRQAQIEQPLLVIIISDSEKKKYSEIKDFIENEIEGFELKQTKVNSQSTFQIKLTEKKYSQSGSLSSPSLIKQKFECDICKIPILREITKSDVEKICGFIAKSKIKREMEWKRVSVELKNSVMTCLTFISDIFYITEQQLFSLLCINNKPQSFKSKVLKLLHEYGILYSFRKSPFRSLNYPKLEFLNKILVKPWIYRDIYDRARNSCFRGSFADVSSVFQDYGKEYEQVAFLIFYHFAVINDIFILDDETVKKNRSEALVEKYIRSTQIIFNEEEETRFESTEAKIFQEKRQLSYAFKQVNHINAILNQNSFLQIIEKQTHCELSNIELPKHFLCFRFIKTPDLIELHWSKKHYDNELEIARKFETPFPKKSGGAVVASLLLNGDKIIAKSEDFVILEINEWNQKGYCLVEKTEKTISFHLRTMVTSYAVYMSVIKCINRLYHLLQNTAPPQKRFCFCPKCLHKGIFTPMQFSLDSVRHEEINFKCKHIITMIECFPDFVYEIYMREMKPIQVGNKLKINEGGYSEIYKTIRNDTQQEIIAKVLFKGDSKESFMLNYTQFVNEIKVSERCKCQWILELVSFSIEDMTLYYEFCEGGNLYKYIDEQSTPFSEEIQLSLILDLAHGIEVLHKNGFIHRDIKSPNVLIKKNPIRCVLCDFGLCSEYDSHYVSQVDNPIWCAPEIIQNEPPTRSSDIYSFSIVIWEILTFKHPFESFTFMTSLIGEILNGTRPDVDLVKNEKLKQLCEEGWDEDPFRRPAINDIIETLSNVH